MELDVTNRERNDLLDREDIELSLTHNGEATPSENDVRKKLAAELDLDPTTIRVDHVYTATGRGTSTAEVTVFDEPVIDELPEEEADEEAADAEEDSAEESEDESEEAVEEEAEEDDSEETEDEDTEDEEGDA